MDQALFKGLLHSLQPVLSSHAGWILTHRPIRGFAPGAGDDAGEIGESIERPTKLTEQPAAQGETLDRIELAMSVCLQPPTMQAFGRRNSLSATAEICAMVLPTAPSETLKSGLEGWMLFTTSFPAIAAARSANELALV